jgi:hypothetical protein
MRSQFITQDHYRITSAADTATYTTINRRKIVPVLKHEAIWDTGGTIPHILHLGNGWK